MQCPECREVKLSVEYPLRISAACKHPGLWCVSCVLKRLRVSVKCPQCGTLTTRADREQLTRTLAFLSQEEHFNVPQRCVPLPLPPPTKPPFFSAKNTQAPQLDSQPSGSVCVFLLGGEYCNVPLSGATTVGSLQGVVAKNLRVPALYQKLVFDGVVVKPIGPGGKHMTLRDYGISNGSRLLCMRLLMSIDRTSGLDHVVFNLSWGYPQRGRDFLDGSCLVYEGEDYLYPINFGHQKDNVTGDALFHSGDVMGTHRGRHTISLSLKRMPKTISHLFFTLSTFSGSDLSSFRTPSVTLCRTESPQPLLEYSLKHAGNSRAIIMCCLARHKKDEEWSVIALGQMSDGDVTDYFPMMKTIGDLFRKGMFREN